MENTSRRPIPNCLMDNIGSNFSRLVNPGGKNLARIRLSPEVAITSTRWWPSAINPHSRGIDYIYNKAWRWTVRRDLTLGGIVIDWWRRVSPLNDVRIRVSPFVPPSIWWCQSSSSSQRLPSAVQWTDRERWLTRQFWCTSRQITHRPSSHFLLYWRASNEKTVNCSQITSATL